MTRLKKVLAALIAVVSQLSDWAEVYAQAAFSKRKLNLSAPSCNC